ncbi:MAG: GldM family protein [Saprospiraceae bacterium]|nr:GldM family protein [Saprospiraceae bacterium]
MAIPKEPRQLMINIMYLVLTALLALNVSAEIFNAFRMVDKGLEESNQALDRQIEAVQNSVEEGAKKKPEFEKYANNIGPLHDVTENLTGYIEELKDRLIDMAGNENGEVDEGDYIVKGDKRKLKGEKNKDVTTRVLINQGVGEELKQKIEQAQEEYLSLVDSSARETFREQQMPLKIDDESWRSVRDKNSWAEFNFKQMPLQATLPIFTKFQNDAKATEAAILNMWNDTVGGRDVVLDRFQVFSSPKKAYVIKGETYETEISLGASASKESNTGVEISVNGRPLEVNDEGSAEWSIRPTSVGVKKYTAEVKVTNPVTGEVQEFERQFEFEVGERSCNVAAKKMNVFYIGVDNPVAVTAAGIPSARMNVSATGSGIQMTKVSGPDYNVTVKQPGEATITVSGGGLEPTPFVFRVKRIPDPVARLGNLREKQILNGVFKAQKGVVAHLDNFDFEARCRIMGFQLVRIAKRQDPEIAINPGGGFNGDAAALVAKAKPGDRYFMENVKAKCPGDAAGRSINDLVFTIK